MTFKHYAIILDMTPMCSCCLETGRHYVGSGVGNSRDINHEDKTLDSSRQT